MVAEPTPAMTAVVVPVMVATAELLLLKVNAPVLADVGLGTKFASPYALPIASKVITGVALITVSAWFTVVAGLYPAEPA